MSVKQKSIQLEGKEMKFVTRLVMVLRCLMMTEERSMGAELVICKVKGIVMALTVPKHCVLGH